KLKKTDKGPITASTNEGVTSSDTISSKLAKSPDAEEREIRRLEKKLGIKSVGKLTKAFAEDGLDDLLEGLKVGSKRMRSSEFSNDLSSEPTKYNYENNVETEELDFEDCSAIEESNKGDEDNIREAAVAIEVKESNNAADKFMEVEH
ncbi:18986_t:CDS:2, partial [Racocetra fulgida]